MRVKSKLIAVVTLIAALGAAVPSDAEPNVLEIAVGQTRVMRFDGLTRLAVGDPEIADVNVFPETLDEAIVNAKKPGMTTLDVWTTPGAAPRSYLVRVSGNTSELESRAYTFKYYKLSRTAYDAKQDLIEIKPDTTCVDNVRAMLIPILGEKNFSLDINRSVVLMQGAARDLDAAARFLAALDVPLKQILIEAKVIEISKDDLKRLGNSLLAQKGKAAMTSDLGGDLESFSLSFDTFTDLARRFKITFDTLRTENVGRTLVNPRIAILDGKTGWIQAGEKYPVASRDSDRGLVSFSYVDTGIMLAVTPRVDNDGSITLWLKPEVSNVTGWVGDPESSVFNAAPIIDTREVMSEVRVRDGESILIGGLHKDEHITTRSKVPVLGDVPLIGSLFRKKRDSTQTSELVVVITPHIIEGNPPQDLDAMMGYVDLSQGSMASAAKTKEPKDMEDTEIQNRTTGGSPWTESN